MKKIILVSALLSSCGGSSDPVTEKPQQSTGKSSETQVQQNSAPSAASTSSPKEEVVVTTEDNTEEKVVVNKKETKQVDTNQVVKQVQKLLASFTITSPSTNNSSLVKTKTPTLIWSASQLQSATLADAEVTYDVRVATNSSCSNPLQSYATTQTTQTLDTLQKGTYYVCVDAKSLDSVKSAGNSPYTLTVEPEEAKIVVTPQPFSITGPGNLVTRTTKINLTWSVSKNATIYEVKKSSTESCNGVTVGTTNETSLAVALTNLEVAYFCVVAKNGENTLGSGNPYKVEVDVESGLVSAQSLGVWNGVWTLRLYVGLLSWNDLKTQGLKWTTSAGKVMYTFSDIHIEEGTDRARYYSKVAPYNVPQINDEWINLVKNY